MSKQTSQWLIPVFLSIGAAGALWYYWSQVSQPETEVPPALPPATVASEPEVDPLPLHPLPAMDAGGSERPDLVPLPALDSSDEYFKLGLTGVFGEAIGNLLVDSGLIEKVVATVDNLPRGHVAERIRPIGKLTDQFRIESQPDASTYTISDSNYERYDPLVNIIAAADLQEMTDLYRRFYPLFQKAYQDLGYPDAYFNDRLVEVIDHLLLAPEPQGPLTLVRPHVLFEYEDESVEGLSSGQKMMLRMGNENAAKMKDTLRQVRELVTDL